MARSAHNSYLPPPGLTGTLPALLLAFLLLAPGAAGQTMPAEGRQALRQLSEEGKRFAGGELTLPDQPDFAFRFEQEIDRRFILRQLYRVHDRRRPAIDACIRWQLLSYSPLLEEYEPWEIERLFATLPSLIVNPCAGDEVLHRYEQMVEAIETMPPGAEQEAERYRALMQQDWRKLEEARESAQALNQPAIRYVAYWREHLREIGGMTGPHEPNLAWAELLNTLKAGWPLRTEKGRLTRALNLRRGDQSFTRRDRHKLKQRIEELVGVRYRVLDGVDFPMRGPPKLSIGNRFISIDDAQRWFEALDDMEGEEGAKETGDVAEPSADDI